ncbi:ankyrin repeat domain-containing protein [Burkholderia anthina]|uniref:ankyrin repeat domain-containing protein n=1 Tax=Burkholderia anthina TaxID=179879 RepID=UPI0037BF94CE
MTTTETTVEPTRDTTGISAPSALHEAIRTGNTPAIDDLIRAGTDLNAPLPARFENEVRYTPLMQAVVVGHPDTVTALLARGADVNGTDAHGRTPLHIAALMASNPVMFEKTGKNTLFEHQIVIMGILLDAGARIDATDGKGLRPLHNAAGYSNPRAVRFLVERGAAIGKDQDHPQSESSYLRYRRDVRNAPLNDNPDVRPWEQTLVLLDALSKGPTTVKV